MSERRLTTGSPPEAKPEAPAANRKGGNPLVPSNAFLPVQPEPHRKQTGNLDPSGKRGEPRRTQPLAQVERAAAGYQATGSKRERLPEKATRLLAAGRVVVERADERGALVVVTGDHDNYRVEVDRAGTSCPCPAWGRRSHERAAWLVARRDEAA
jgi:hypothetical protein